MQRSVVRPINSYLSLSLSISKKFKLLKLHEKEMIQFQSVSKPFRGEALLLPYQGRLISQGPLLNLLVWDNVKESRECIKVVKNNIATLVWYFSP